MTVRLPEWSKLEPGVSGSGGASVLTGLQLDGPEERRAAAILRRAGRLVVDELATGLRIETTSFVGRIQLGSLVITIEPKVAKQSLLALVRYAYGFRDVYREGTTSFGTTGTLLPDLLAAQLVAEVEELVGRGLPRRYVERRDDLRSPRGRLDIAALARRGTVSDSLPCRHYQRSANYVVLQVIRSGLEVAAQIAMDSELVLSLRRLARRLGVDVSDVPISRDRVARARRAVTRLDAATTPALGLIELLLDGQAVTLEDETTVRLPGFLFDMNRFFQALICRWLKENLPDCEVQDERGLKGLLAYAPGLNPRNRRAPTPRPDFTVRKAGAVTLLDAKYRDLWERDLPREMLYQLAMYATSGGGADGVAVILYPTENESATEARVDIRDVVVGTLRGGVALRPVILPTLAGLIESAQGTRTREAERLAFGPA